MDGDAKLEGVADARGFHARTYPAPERRVEQDHVDGAVQHVGGELLEIDDDGVRGERQAQLLAGMPHTGEAEDRILEVVVVEILNCASEPDGLLRRPDGIRIEAERVAGEGLGHRAIALEVVRRREDAAFELVRP